jgi:Leucine-rich repeat (LRR) protein
LLPQTLDLSNNKIKTIENLEGLPLRELNLSNNCIEDLNGIQSLKYLTSLNISGNSIYSLIPLQQCTNLSYLDITNNKIQYIRQVEYLTGIPWLQVFMIDGNPCCQKEHYRFRTLYRLPNLQRLDDITVTADEKVRQDN